MGDKLILDLRKLFEEPALDLHKLGGFMDEAKGVNGSHRERPVSCHLLSGAIRLNIALDALGGQFCEVSAGLLGLGLYHLETRVVTLCGLEGIVGRSAEGHSLIPFSGGEFKGAQVVIDSHSSFLSCVGRNPLFFFFI